MEARPLTRVDVPAAAAALARALTDDPGWIAVLRDDATRTARIASILRTALRVHYRDHDESWCVGEIAGAVWSPPGHHALPAVHLLRAAPRLLWAARGGIRAGAALLSAMESAQPAEPHYYLAFLGVDPAHQGRGLGARVLAPILARCDAERRLAWLETGNPRNHAFYRRLGFTPAAERTFPFGVTLTWFARAPR